jgi:hypothetical protein
MRYVLALVLNVILYIVHNLDEIVCEVLEWGLIFALGYGFYHWFRIHFISQAILTALFGIEVAHSVFCIVESLTSFILTIFDICFGLIRFFRTWRRAYRQRRAEEAQRKQFELELFRDNTTSDSDSNSDISIGARPQRPPNRNSGFRPSSK